MQQTKNIWINTNKAQVEGIKRQLLEHDYAGGYGGSINLMAVNNIIDGAIVEIVKLQKQIEELEVSLKEATTKKKPGRPKNTDKKDEA